jgi:hypothetical protein
MTRTVSDSTSLLRLLPEGKYAGHGTYSYSEKASQVHKLEASATLSHTELLLVLEGAFTLSNGARHMFKLDLELPANDAGKGYFVFEFAPLTQIVGVLGNVDGGAYLLAGRSKEPPTQLSCHLALLDDRNFTLQGLLAYEDFKWLTWSVSIRNYDPQKAKDAVVSLPRRA